MARVDARAGRPRSLRLRPDEGPGRALFDAPDAWTMVEVGEQTGCKLPGVGVHEADLPSRA